MKKIFIKIFLALLFILAVLGIISKVNAATMYEVKKDVNMRSKASTSGVIYAELKQGEEVRLVEKGNWHKVTYEEEGYIHKNYFNVSNNKTKADVNLRESNTSKSRVKAVLAKGQSVTLIQRQGIWCKVKYKKTGYIAKNYLIEFMEVKVDTTSAKKIDLKMRNAPGTSSTIVAKLKHGSSVYTSTNNLVNIKNANGYEWVLVKLSNGREGYVANKYLKFSNGKSCADIDKCYEVKINQEGTINGYLGIDVATGSAIKAREFEKLISGEKKISGNTIYENNLCDFKPAFVYLKFGATGWGDSFSIANSTTPDDVVEFIKLCEKYEIPYGGYYYTQCVSKEEADKEVEYIQDIFNKAEKEIGKLNYHKLPFAIDIENPAKRMGKFVKGTGSKAKLTEVKNYMINQVRIIDEVDDIIVYTDRNALRELINFKNLDQKNQDLWMVDPISCDTHSKDIVNLGYMDYIDIRQIRLDYRMSGIGTMDINLMNKDVFEKLTK